MPIDRRRLIFGSVAGLGAQMQAGAGSAQNWPSKNIVIVVPFPAGGSADLSARLLAEHLRRAFGQPAFVENKPGVGGNLAAAEAARAPADGHTLFIGTNGTQTINESLYRQLPYDPTADFAAIGMMWSAPHLVVVHPALPVQSLEAFVAYARAHARELSYGSSGIGSSTHLFGELFKAQTGISMVHVPYRGQGPALEDLIGGRIQAMFPIVPDVIASIRTNQVRVLASAAKSPSAILPNVPLTAQLGHPDLVASAWVALYAPARTPAATVERLRQELDKLSASGSFVGQMKDVGIEVHHMRADEFAAFVEQERNRWAKVIQTLNLKIE
jgi:tripartite-type tricarboxylate transporter receptor subunit TctC